MGKGLEIENKRDMEEQMDSETREFVNDMMLKTRLDMENNGHKF